MLFYHEHPAAREEPVRRRVLSRLTRLGGFREGERRNLGGKGKKNRKDQRRERSTSPPTRTSGPRRASKPWIHWMGGLAAGGRGNTMRRGGCRGKVKGGGTDGEFPFKPTQTHRASMVTKGKNKRMHHLSSRERKRPIPVLRGLSKRCRRPTRSLKGHAHALDDES